jgi:hypothetical protein
MSVVDSDMGSSSGRNEWFKILVDPSGDAPSLWAREKVLDSQALGRVEGKRSEQVSPGRPKRAQRGERRKFVIFPVDDDNRNAEPFALLHEILRELLIESRRQMIDAVSLIAPICGIPPERLVFIDETWAKARKEQVRRAAMQKARAV